MSKLSAEEKALIAGRLSASKARRRRIRPRSVRIVVDGRERCGIDLTTGRQLQIELVEGAKLIEIRGRDEKGDLLLSTHLISYAREAFELSKVVLPFQDGQLSLTVSPLPSCSEGIRGLLTLNFKHIFQMSWAPLLAPGIRFAATQGSAAR